jgi:8-oxo-dGTP pyrophosphatase MutT (NUDIX family)
VKFIGLGYHREMEPALLHHRSLAEIIPADAFVGAGLILPHPGPADNRRGSTSLQRFLFGIRPLRWDGTCPIAEITAIGGRIETFDASLSDGVQREACEEVGCDVRLASCSRTLLSRGPGELETTAIEGSEQPAAVVFRYYKAPAHQPWNAPSPGHPNYRPPSCIILFLGELTGEPLPSEELPTLIWLTPEQILETARRDVLFSELLASGTPVLRLREGYPADEHWARLTDSQEALALSLGDSAIDFFQQLQRL